MSLKEITLQRVPNSTFISNGRYRNKFKEKFHGCCRTDHKFIHFYLNTNCRNYKPEIKCSRDTRERILKLNDKHGEKSEKKRVTHVLLLWCLRVLRRPNGFWITADPSI